jgi:hypothetical protein
LGTITGETGGSPMQVAAETRENGDNRGRSNATGINNTNEDDGIQSYNVNTEYIEDCFMTENSKVFNVAAREHDDEFTILPLAGIGIYLCIGAYVPNSKAGVEQYFRHDLKFNNIKDKLRIRTPQGIGQLKRGMIKILRISRRSEGIN